MLQSNFDRKNLESKKVDELRSICKDCGISYYEHSKRITKAAMIDKILKNTMEVVINEKANKKNDKDIEQVEQNINAYEQTAVYEGYEEEQYIKLLKKEKENAERFEVKKKYIEEAKIGTIVAFKLPDGKVISAAIKKKSTKKRKFLVETKYGVEHKILFEDVLWVKTNKRWPKGIYLMFKNNIKSGVTKNAKEREVN